MHLLAVGAIVTVGVVVTAAVLGGVAQVEPFAPASARACPGGWYREIDGFLTPEQCDAIRAAATAAGMTVSEVGGGPEPQRVALASRRSEQAWLGEGTNAATAAFAQKVRDVVAGPDAACFPAAPAFELIQVVRYAAGGKYDPHYDGDACGAECPASQRVATVLVYLNDDFEGGGTRFPELDVIVRPAKGKALVFWVSDPASRDLYRETLHGGDPVESGEKWIATQWVRTAQP